MRIYHYEKCDTCRRAIRFLREHGIEFTPIPIRERPPSKAEIRRMLAIYQGDIRRLFNTSGRDYRAMDLKTCLPTMTEEAAISLLAGNGNLIKRPFALTEDSGRIGFQKEEWGMFL